MQIRKEGQGIHLLVFYVSAKVCEFKQIGRDKLL